MSLGVVLLQVVRVVGGRHGKSELGGEAKHPLGDGVFFGNAVILHLQPEAIRSERPGEPLGARLRGLVIPLAQIQRDFPGETGGEPDQPLAMPLQYFLIDARPAVIALEESY